MTRSWFHISVHMRKSISSLFKQYPTLVTRAWFLACVSVRMCQSTIPTVHTSMTRARFLVSVHMCKSMCKSCISTFRHGPVSVTQLSTHVNRTLFLVDVIKPTVLFESYWCWTIVPKWSFLANTARTVPYCDHHCLGQLDIVGCGQPLTPRRRTVDNWSVYCQSL